jgi:hypothetical protein
MNKLVALIITLPILITQNSNSAMADSSTGSDITGNGSSVENINCQDFIANENIILINLTKNNKVFFSDINSLKNAKDGVRILQNLDSGLSQVKKNLQEIQVITTTNKCQDLQEAITTLENKFKDSTTLLNSDKDLVSQYVNLLNLTSGKVSPNNSKSNLAESKKVIAVQKAKNTADYNFGFNMVINASRATLRSWSMGNFLTTNGKLTLVNAKDWCNQIPKLIPGLAQGVGFPPSTGFISGCSTAAIKIFH